MRKKKGFTLVELIAVIVVLAVITLIAVPTVLGVIDKARRSSLQDSGYGLVEAANLYYAQYSPSKTVRFDIENNKIITEENDKLNYKGTVKNGTVLINNKGQITVCINDGKHAAYKNYQDTKVMVVDSKTCTVPESSYIVYLDGESTITELTIQELTQEIENLKQLIEQQNEKIETLESEKSNQTEVTNIINNLTSTHNSDISLINSKIGITDISSIGNGTITSSINSLNSNIISINNQLTETKSSTNLINYLDGNLYEKINLNSKMWVIQGYVNQTLPAGAWYYVGIVNNKPIDDCAIITVTSSGNSPEGALSAPFLFVL